MSFIEGKIERIKAYYSDEFMHIDAKCSACSGSGRYDHNGSPKCGACDGTGKEKESVVKRDSTLFILIIGIIKSNDYHEILSMAKNIEMEAKMTKDINKIKYLIQHKIPYVIKYGGNLNG